MCSCSFPGGKRDSCDRDAIATAVRETREELSLCLEEDHVWGVMTPLPDRVMGPGSLRTGLLSDGFLQGSVAQCGNSHGVG